MIKNILIGTGAMYNRATMDCPGFNEAMQISERITINRDDEVFKNVSCGAILIGPNNMAIVFGVFGKVEAVHPIRSSIAIPMSLSVSDKRIVGTGHLHDVLYPVQVTIAGFIEDNDLSDIHINVRIEHEKLSPLTVAIQWSPFKYYIRGLS